MNHELYLAIGAGALLVVLIFGVGFLLRRKPRKLNHAYYQDRWDDLQHLCKDKATWPLAVIDADKLLDNALKQLRFRGKTMGERLVAAQRSITSNDDVWYAHKLRNRLVHEANVKLREREVKDALMGIRRALKDLGAL